MQPRPIAADATKWRDVSINDAQITITGGFNTKGELAESIQYKCADNGTHTFVALHKEAQWFVKGVGGARKGELKAVNVLAMIRQKASEADYETIDAETSPAVAGSDSQDGADDDYDPMDEMIALDSVAEAVTRPSKGKNAKSTVLACKSCRFLPDLSASTPQVKGKQPSLCTRHPQGKTKCPTYV